LEAQRAWLPQFKDRKLEPKPRITIPENIEPAEVPLDPALAIANRFTKLAEQET
jgi:alpha-galactosidase